MVEFKNMPLIGQFVAVYQYNGEVWSGTYRWDEDGLITEYCFNDDDDYFSPVGGMGDYNSLPWVCNVGIKPKFFGV
jgi:hypothetical protein